MKTATGNVLLRTYLKAVKNLQSDEAMTASATSAGFVIPTGQKRGQRTGFQVFVKVCRYSEELLKRKSDTGGLLCEAKSRSPAIRWRHAAALLRKAQRLIGQAKWIYEANAVRASYLKLKRSNGKPPAP